MLGVSLPGVYQISMTVTGRSYPCRDRGAPSGLKNAMKLGAGGAEPWDSGRRSPTRDRTVTARATPADMETCVGSPPAPRLVSGRRYFGFGRRSLAKDLPLYSPDEGAAGETGA